MFEGDIYCGKKKGSLEHGLGEEVVIQLTKKIKNLECQIFIDNFLNTPMQKNLLENRILSAGTVCINCKHLPKTKIPSDKSMKRGDVVSLHANKIHLSSGLTTKQSLYSQIFIQPLQHITL